MNLDDSLREQIRTNGDFSDTAQLAQALKFALRQGKHWSALPMGAKEALEQMQTRISMILSGDPNHTDHWNKLAMYARVIAKSLELDTTKPSNRLAEIQAARQAAGIKIMGSAIEDEPDA